MVEKATSIHENVLSEFKKFDEIFARLQLQEKNLFIKSFQPDYVDQGDDEYGYGNRVYYVYLLHDFLRFYRFIDDTTKHELNELVDETIAKMEKLTNEKITRDHPLSKLKHMMEKGAKIIDKDILSEFEKFDEIRNKLLQRRNRDIQFTNDVDKDKEKDYYYTILLNDFTNLYGSIHDDTKRELNELSEKILAEMEKYIQGTQALDLHKIAPDEVMVRFVRASYPDFFKSVVKFDFFRDLASKVRYYDSMTDVEKLNINQKCSEILSHYKGVFEYYVKWCGNFAEQLESGIGEETAYCPMSDAIRQTPESMICAVVATLNAVRPLLSELPDWWPKSNPISNAEVIEILNNFKVRIINRMLKYGSTEEDEVRFNYYMSKNLGINYQSKVPGISLQALADGNKRDKKIMHVERWYNNIKYTKGLVAFTMPMILYSIQMSDKLTAAQRFGHVIAFSKIGDTWYIHDSYCENAKQTVSIETIKKVLRGDMFYYKFPSECGEIQFVDRSIRRPRFIEAHDIVTSSTIHKIPAVGPIAKRNEEQSPGEFTYFNMAFVVNNAGIMGLYYNKNESNEPPRINNTIEALSVDLGCSRIGAKIAEFVRRFTESRAIQNVIKYTSARASKNRVSAGGDGDGDGDGDGGGGGGGGMSAMIMLGLCITCISALAPR